MTEQTTDQTTGGQTAPTTDGPVTGEVTDGDSVPNAGEAPVTDHGAHDHHDHSGHDHAHHGHGHGHDHGDLPDVPEASGGVSSSRSATVSLDDVEEAMKDVVDPELGINVVDLGLVYGIHVDEDSNAVIDMTLTSAACPLTDVISDQTSTALEGIVNDVAINWVWMPPWGPDKITDDGRDQLRALGFNV